MLKSMLLKSIPILFENRYNWYVMLVQCLSLHYEISYLYKTANQVRIQDFGKGGPGNCYLIKRAAFAGAQRFPLFLKFMGSPKTPPPLDPPLPTLKPESILNLV